MYIFFIGLVLVAFQVTCHGAPGRSFPESELPSNVSQEEEQIEKRTACKADKSDHCGYWQGEGFCGQNSIYHGYMQEHCDATCNCKSSACKDDRSEHCGYWKGEGYCQQSSVYYHYMIHNCYATCSNCKSSSNAGSQACKADKSDHCGYWQGEGFCGQDSIYHGYMQEHCDATCNCKSSSNAGSQEAKLDVHACLKAHNDRRARHSAPELEWDDTLAQHAQEWADHLAATETFEHAKGTGEGENLYRGGDGCPIATKLWYDEIKDYNFNNPGFSMKTGHFTQVVWKGTRKLGVAIATDSKGRNYVVARYYPPGNVIGAFAQNV
ncbi:hypothetical protein ACROYT_G009920 [Oculina patagonica]